MGTKNDPGAFDCYAAADPDEPMFILLGRDRHAAMLVRLWAMLRALDGEQTKKTDEALQCAKAMNDWRESLGKAAAHPKVERAFDSMALALLNVHLGALAPAPRSDDRLPTADCRSPAAGAAR